MKFAACLGGRVWKLKPGKIARYRENRMRIASLFVAVVISLMGMQLAEAQSSVPVSTGPSCKTFSEAQCKAPRCAWVPDQMSTEPACKKRRSWWDVTRFFHGWDVVGRVERFMITNKAWAGPILGLFAFGESLVLVGLFFPATALMFAAGVLIQKGKLDPTMVIGWSIAGAVLGDFVTYWIGRWIGLSVVRRYPFNRDPSAIAKARLFFRKYGFLSIFIGRFLGPIRSTIPLVAGMMKMRHVTFQIANVTSAMVWVPVFLSFGYFGGKLFPNLDEITWKQWVLLAVVVIGFTLGVTYLTLKLSQRKPKDKRQDHTLGAHKTAPETDVTPANT